MMNDIILTMLISIYTIALIGLGIGYGYIYAKKELKQKGEYVEK